VENTEKGWFISWIDTSPEAMKRRDASMKRERLEKGEADREDRLIQEQVERARQEAIEKQLDEADAAMWPDTIKDEDLKEEEEEEEGEDEDEEPSASRSNQDQVDVKMEDVETTVPPDEKPAVIAPMTLQKPLRINNVNLSLKKPTNPLKASNPLASKKSDNPLKSAMKKEAKKLDPIVNDNGKRPLPKAVEIMNEELERKRAREERYNRDRDNRYSRDLSYRDHSHPRELVVDRR
jgi:DNA/RNA-binding protein KIN17